MLKDFWNREPVFFLTLVQAALGLLLAFGVTLSPAQVGAIMSFTAAVLGFVIRTQVTPTSSLAATPPPPVQRIVWLPIILVTGIAMSISACVHPKPPTPVAAVADAATRIEDSAGALLTQAQTASTTIDPRTQQPLISRAQLDAVALVVDRVGRLGLTLDAGLTDYVRVRDAGGNLQGPAASVQAVLTSIRAALADVASAIPAGTSSAIDQAVSSVLQVVLSVSSVVGL